MAYTTIDNSEEHFQTFGYTGDGTTSAGKTRTFDGNADLKPGIMYQHKFAGGGNYHNIMECEWPKGPGWHWLADSGDAKQDGITASFDTDGFTHATENLGGYYHNENGKSYGIWAWSETGVTQSSNTDGTITSSVRAHPDAGWSIVNWTGTSADGTIGHGLGKKPDALWMYPIQVAANNGNTQRPQWWSANSWNHNFNTGLNENRNESDSTNGRLGASSSNSQGTSSIFSVFVGNSQYEAVNHSSQDYMCIAWTSIQGFSKFGKYKGNGNADGAFTYTGFKPALIIIKKFGTSGFQCFDNRRDPINKDSGGSINLTSNYGAETRDSNTKIDFLSNGFKIRTTGGQVNASNTDYAFGAFAENPFVTSTGVPGLAR